MKSNDLGELLKLQKSIEAIEGLLGSSLSDCLENYRSILSGITDMACISDASGEHTLP